MVNIVILGSTRFAPYNVLVPDPIDGATNDDVGYKIASKIFHPAIEDADIVIVYCPDGIGVHTHRDIEHAIKHKKPIFYILNKEDVAFISDDDGAS